MIRIHAGKVGASIQEGCDMLVYIGAMYVCVYVCMYVCMYVCANPNTFLLYE